ncbi:hypothetical protein AMTRI_Chr02g257690 [Amborella trichopoda]
MAATATFSLSNPSSPFRERKSSTPPPHHHHRYHYHRFLSSAYSTPKKSSLSLEAVLSDSPIDPATLTTHQKNLYSPLPSSFISRFADEEPRKGADILVEALERENVQHVFAYPGGASLEIHQALTRSTTVSNVLCHHEQGEIFAAEGYARSTGKVGVCIATSGPGATNLVIAITGQVPRRMIGTDAFQETPIVEVTRSITKHNYLVLNVDDIPRIVREAFFLASSGRPGPVLIDVPKDVQQQMAIPDWYQPMKIHGYINRLLKNPDLSQLELIVRLILGSKRPVLYVGGGCLNASEELRRFVELTGIPVASTLMGLGSYSCSDDLSLRMLGMHGTVYANYAVDKADLLLAFGVRFDDRVTGKLEAFASRASIVHVDIDPAEIGKNKQPHVSLCADIRLALRGLNHLFEERERSVSDSFMEREGGLTNVGLDFSAWRQELQEQKRKWPLSYQTFGEAIPPQYAIKLLEELTKGKAIISSGVGQHQMWAAQFYDYQRPRQWLTSGGLGAMGFELPAAIGAAVGNPDSIVVDIDGDGSFMMNVQELATIRVENLPVKMMVLNNQHLGMVVQWEDRFYKANRAHTYLGDPSRESEIFPDLLNFAEACDIPAARVTKLNELKAAILKMLETPGPYLLDVVVPHQEHVLPMIPRGGAFKDIITEGDGRT